MKILITGLPGSGKTWIAQRLQPHLDCAIYNGDVVRTAANDWDFSLQGRLRQARRMRAICDFERAEGRTVIADFVCPTALTRYIFEADYTIWMDTVKACRYEDTNLLFEPPQSANLVITSHIAESDIPLIINSIAGTHV